MIHMHITSAMTAHLKITAQNPQLDCNEYSAVTNTLSNIFPVHVCLHKFIVRHHDEPCEPVRAVKGESHCWHNISVIQQHAAHYMNMQPNVKTSATPCHAILTNCFAVIHRFFPNTLETSPEGRVYIRSHAACQISCMHMYAYIFGPPAVSSLQTL